MAYTIRVRELRTRGPANEFVLAHSIMDRAQAEHLVARLATSYPRHGFDPDRGIYWFQGFSGLHEIWAAADA
ncbi:hypothetical protein M446_0314 [Methylobacterium sp. 4-46]|uniref:hypothetical protein n=1 Tax=unclassified Methylobacterium TaxID=2615210 RepID=UPI000165C5C6|nr:MULTISPECIES: hypothetical protein [Methylobacterium]ACA14885.1 hypothetical protein M446_0314 [Methylobacterium sp. 4-46]WFT80625.1 hypothetical protein QA634_01580 [Methylobacterium nodulans]